ncbi:MAG: diacylglycerol kinase [Bacteroidetes bacterium GWF2_49_14]|nr:MAG: diacylglycerol kinase [Bacteroidetes bacterium GWF2_49_14]HBB92251.1 diacylglycerol kinase [Bacteroidales bacterium]
MPTKKFSIRARFISFKFAFRGLGLLFREEHNSWIYLVFIAALIPAGIIFHLTAAEWMLITLCIGIVISAEIFNTIIERISDKIAPDYDPVIGKIKDLGAAAVLVLAIATAVVGLIIFLPKVL